MASSANSNHFVYHGLHENAIPPLAGQPRAPGEIHLDVPVAPPPPHGPRCGSPPARLADPRPPAPSRGRDLRRHGGGGQDPGGVPRVVLGSREGTVHSRGGAERPRFPHPARRLDPSSRDPLPHPRGGVVGEHAGERLFREVRGGRGKIHLGDPRDLRLPRSPRVPCLPEGPSGGCVAARDPGPGEGGTRGPLAMGEAALHRRMEILGLPDPSPLGVRDYAAPPRRAGLPSLLPPRWRPTGAARYTAPAPPP